MGPEAVHQVRGARAYIVLVLSLTLKLPFFEQPSNVIFSKRIILLLRVRLGDLSVSLRNSGGCQVK